jgi:hypothetical protein
VETAAAPARNTQPLIAHAPPGIFEDIGAGNKELFSYQLSYKRGPFHPRAPGSLAQQALFISSESHG